MDSSLIHPFKIVITVHSLPIKNLVVYHIGIYRVDFYPLTLDVFGYVYQMVDFYPLTVADPRGVGRSDPKRLHRNCQWKGSPAPAAAAVARLKISGANHGGSGTIKVCKVLESDHVSKWFMNSSRGERSADKFDWGLKCSSNSESGPRELHQRNRWWCHFMSPCAPCAKSPIHFLKLVPNLFLRPWSTHRLDETERSHFFFTTIHMLETLSLLVYPIIFPPLCWYCPFTKKTYQQHINNVLFAHKPSLAQQLEMLEFKLHL